MTGPVEWGVLIFVVMLLTTAITMSWRARSMLSRFELRVELRLADLEKDVRHTKEAVKQHGIIGADILLTLGRIKDKVKLSS